MRAILFKTIFLIAISSCFVFVSHAQRSQTHPYLFFTPQRIQHVQERIKTDTSMARIWGELRDGADRAIAEKRSVSLEVLSLAWSLTRDKKYAESAKEGILKLISQNQWDGLDDRTPRWSAGLSTARNSFLTALTFDCIYEYLTKDERRKIAEGVVTLGIRPSIDDWLSDDKRLHSLNSMGHNWWSACTYMTGVASLAVMNEVPEAKEWAENIMESSKEWFSFSGSVLENKPSNFDPAGGFYESIGYADFGMSEYLLFRLAYTNVFGAVKMPYDHLIEKTADWFINSCYPNKAKLMSVNFGDSSPYGNGAKSLKLMLALGFRKERYYWYLDQVTQGEPRKGNVESPVYFVYAPESKQVPESPDLPSSAIYQDMGWAMMRSSWGKNETMLGVKCGYTWNHAHADAGSFILYHNGKNLLTDAGNVNYGLPEYSSYFVRSEAHNVILFDGKAQDPQDQFHAVKNPGRLYNLVDGVDLKYVLADATGPTSRHFLRNYRSFLWVGDVILVIDDLKTYEPGKFEWLLHFDKEAKKKGPDLEIANDSASVLVRPLFPETLPTGYPHDFPEKMKLQERIGMKDHDHKTKLTYFSIFPPEPSRQTKFITAIILLNERNKTVDTFTGSSGANAANGRSNLPRIEKLQGTDMIGVKITQHGEVTYIYFNLLADGRLMHRNSNNSFNGWDTDSYLTAISFPEKSDHSNPDNLTSIFISNGSYLRTEEKVVLSSLSKVFMYASFKRKIPEVTLHGQPVINAKLRMTKGAQEVILNRSKIQPDYKADKKMVMLEVNESVK